MKFCRWWQTFAGPHVSVEREITLCGLTRVAGRTVSRLSGGERQRIAIAAMFIPDVTSYLLDEPTMSLDPIGIRFLIDRLAAARDEGRAVLFTTHTAAELEELATEVAMLRDGRIVPVTQDAEPGARHLSLAIAGGPEVWVGAALRGGAHRAWPERGRLHATVPDLGVGEMLSRLEYEGARVSSYRSESALADALHRLNEEEHHDEVPPPHSVDRCVAAGRLWRGAAWARADSAGPR